MNYVRSKDAQKQLARTSLSELLLVEGAVKELGKLRNKTFRQFGPHISFNKVIVVRVLQEGRLLRALWTAPLVPIGL